MINQLLLAPSLVTAIPNISRTQAVSANAATATISSTTVNDLIVVFAYSTSTTIPSTPIGYTSIQNAAGTQQAYRIGWKLAGSGETTIGTWTNATQVAAIVLRGVKTSGPIGTSNAFTAGNSASLSYTALTLSVNNGTSWILGFGGAKGATAGMNGNTASLTNRTNQTTCNGLDLGPTGSNFSAETLSVTGSGRWFAGTVEILSS